MLRNLQNSAPARVQELGGESSGMYAWKNSNGWMPDNLWYDEQQQSDLMVHTSDCVK